MHDRMRIVHDAPGRALVRATREAEFRVACAAIDRGAPLRLVVGETLSHWGAPARLVKKKYGSDSGGPGEHGIPEIGRLEEQFFGNLTEGQKEAYRDLERLVTILYERGMTWEGVDPFAIGEPLDQWKLKAIAQLAAQPMQAFLLGQFLATEATGGKLARPLTPEDRRTIDFLEHYAFSEIDSSFDELKANIRNALIDGMRARVHPREIARAIANELDDHTTAWELIAITETARAESQGRLQELLDRGYTQAIGSSAHDSRVCPHCLRLIDGKVVTIADVIGQSNYGRKVDAWIAVIPLHPRCRCVWLPWPKGGPP